MKIAVVGTGYVGLVSGTCFAELGWHVTCIDKNKSKIAKLQRSEIPIFEPGLRELVKSNARTGRLEFSDDLADVSGKDVVFIAVGTPTIEGSHQADLSYVYAAAKEVAPYLEKNVVVVIKSTVPVGTGKRVKNIIKKVRPKLKFTMASNPEFLREGCAVNDFLEPDRVIVGIDSDKESDTLLKIYKPLTSKGVPIVFTDIQTAELTKYAANAFLATKIAFVNEMADICEKVGANIEDVAYGMGLDHRIGTDYMKPGPGYGGSCFPKDTRALDYVAEKLGVPSRIVSTVIDTNEERKKSMARRVSKACGGTLKKKNIAVLGLAFKANTDDMRDSPALDIIPELIKQGASVQVFDPEGMTHAKTMLKQKAIRWCLDEDAVLEKVDAAVIVTEWQVFKTLDWKRAKKRMKKAVVVDLRNLLDAQQMHDLGFQYIPIGRPPETKARKK